MKNKGSFYTLLLIIAVGVTITTCTSYFLGSSSGRGKNVKAEYKKQVMDDEAVPFSDGDGGVASGGMSGTFGILGQEKQARQMPDGKETGEEAEIEQGEAGGGGLPYSALASGFDVQADFSEGISGEAAMAGDSQSEGAACEWEDMEGEARVFDVEAESFLEADGLNGSQEKQLQKSNQEVNADSVLISPLETNASQNDSQSKKTAKASYYRNRLSELDVQIQKSRENQASTQTNINSESLSRSTASGELKLWDSELNVIYDEILKRMDEKQAKELVEEERQWMKERDRLAAEAAKASSGDAQESVEYTASLAESTRARAYELVNAYEYLLVD